MPAVTSTESVFSVYLARVGGIDRGQKRSVWASPRSAKTEPILRRLDAVSPHVAALTEDLRTLTTWPHVRDAGQHPKVRGPQKRKVAIASKLPMKLVDVVGSPELPPNNFLAVDIEAPFGTVRVIGIVIRWNQKAC